MKTLNIFVLAFMGILSLSVLSSCGGGGTSDQKADTTQVEATPEQGASAEQMALGKGIFEAKCIVCHQKDGNGIANVFPTLKGSNFLLNNTKLAVSQVLNGSVAVVADRSIKYPAPMPPQVASLDSAVAVINYVLNNFGNTGGYITVDEVKDITINPR
ncbi:MAG: cytochrome c [Bacteroidales bacterium]|nr:cytochrome c [Bacteroidales bacterium]